MLVSKGQDAFRHAPYGCRDLSQSQEAVLVGRHDSVQANMKRRILFLCKDNSTKAEWHRHCCSQSKEDYFQ